MRTRFILPLLALGLTAVAAPAAAQSVNDFQLPPNPSPTPTPRAQGPVDDSGVVPVAPRPIPTATPSRTPAPTASPTADPAQGSTGQPSPVPSRAPAPRPAATPQAQRPAQGTATPAAPDAVATSAADAGPLPGPPTSRSAPVPAPAPFPTAEAPDATVSEDSVLPDWWWIAALVAAIVALVGGLWLWRSRAAAKIVPEIVRPAVAGADEVPAKDDLLRYLTVEVEPVRLTRSMMAATLAYRITLSNRASEAIRSIALDGDLTSAHGAAPIGEQLADRLTVLPLLHEIDHLGPGQRKSFTGEIRLELKQVRPIRQGSVPIYVPLMRLRTSAAGAEPKAFTFVVGKAPAMPGGRLQPFRLDTPPQTFNEIGARPLG